jgi:hypothetical protein
LTSETPLPATAEAVLTFLESVGRRSDAELYLRLFRKIPRQSFAIVAVEGKVVRHALGSLVEQLRFLDELGLVAPVVVGLFDPATAHDGANQLASRLPEVGLRPTLHLLSEPSLSRILRGELQQGEVPILRFVPRAGQDLGARFEALGSVAADLATRRVVVVRRQGGLGPRGETPLVLERGHALERHAEGISVVNLRTDLDALLTAQVLSEPDAALVRHSRQMLERAESRPTISVTSPLNLLRELFTVKGAGTLIKVGTEIKIVHSYGELDRYRLRDLLEGSFERRLDPSFLERPPQAVYLERDYRGVAIIEPSPVAPYLSKFAVERVARGDGIGQDLWQMLTRDQASLVWRCRPQNPVRDWYASVCDGMHRLADWHVFWRGLAPDQVPAAIEEACRRPNDFAV